MGIFDDSYPSKPKTFSQWQQVRRSNPRLYYNASTQNRMLKDVEALGHDKFYTKEISDDEKSN